MTLRRDQISLHYELTFLSPFHIGSGHRRGTAQRAVSRDAEGLLFVPGSAIKGIARERSEQIARLFGLAAAEPHGEGAEPSRFFDPGEIVDSIYGSRLRPGTLWFDDALMHEDDAQLFDAPGAHAAAKYREFQVERRTRVGMSRLTGAARAGHLFSSEYGMAGLRFRGRVRGALGGHPLPDGQADATYELLLLLAGLLAIDRVGSNRSAGAGGCQISLREFRVNGVERQADKLFDYFGDLEYYALEAEAG